MKNRKLCSSKVLKKIINCLIIYLNELSDLQKISQFTEGEIIAFVECLEIASEWKQFRKFGIEDIEEKFKIK